MLKRIVVLFAAISLVTGSLSAMSYQGVLLNSAETIDPGNFKLAIAPAMILGKNGGDSVWGVAGKGGLGLARRFDLEISGALFRDLKYFGVDLEYWFFKGPSVNMSASAGWHMTDFKTGPNSSGIDATLIVSTRPVRKLEITGALKFSFDSFKNTDQNITLIHAVPGIEYKITHRLDALAEFGIALNNDSRHYLCLGLSYYFL
ncbi:MAG: hypothetical protein JXB26_13225 [Candidatus Aminicenantes bacterium]|nr:hypothetical protein [Candidatus Aminicenantes bacterium]